MILFGSFEILERCFTSSACSAQRVKRRVFLLGVRAKHKEGIVAGDPEVVYPIMHWLLHDLPFKKKKAYVAHFLINVDVPGEFMQDEGMFHASRL